MVQTTLQRAVWMTLFTLIVLAIPLGAQAGTINIILSDMDVTYFGGVAGGSVYDTVSHTGGNLDPAESDEVETAVFEQNMVHEGTLMTSPSNRLYGDLKVDGVGTSLALGFAGHPGIGNNGGGFGFDWFTTSGNRLRLGIDTIDLLLTNGVYFFTGSASVLDQNLPFGLAFDMNQSVVFSYTATLPGIVGSPATGAMGSGALTISGEMAPIPEPSSLDLLLAAAVVVGALRVGRLPLPQSLPAWVEIGRRPRLLANWRWRDTLRSWQPRLRNLRA